jgi:hypothetical protein
MMAASSLTASWAHPVRQADLQKVPLRANFFAEPAGALSLSLAMLAARLARGSQALDFQREFFLARMVLKEPQRHTAAVNLESIKRSSTS